MIVLRALVAVLLILNGLVTQPAYAMHARDGMASHAAHHQSMPAPDTMPANHGHGGPPTDCCNGVGCNCGCAVPHTLSLPIVQLPPVGRAPLSEFTFIVKSFDSTPHATPFRPPA